MRLLNAIYTIKSVHGYVAPLYAVVLISSFTDSNFIPRENVYSGHLKGHDNSITRRRINAFLWHSHQNNLFSLFMVYVYDTVIR